MLTTWRDICMHFITIRQRQVALLARNKRYQNFSTKSVGNFVINCACKL